MYIVQGTFYKVQCTGYMVQCTVYSVQFTEPVQQEEETPDGSFLPSGQAKARAIVRDMGAVQCTLGRCTAV